VFIIYLSLLPGGTGIMILFGIPHFDKIGHAGGYGVWAFLLILAAQKNFGANTARNWWIVAALCLVGCGLEFGQYYMHQGRSFEVLDMLANTLGSVTGFFVSRFFLKKSC
jgi:VanZ family protein